MHPLNQDGAEVWKERSVDEIRAALKRKTVISMKNAAGTNAGMRRRAGDGEGDGRYERVRASGREVV
jgi:putative membrane protein